MLKRTGTLLACIFVVQFVTGCATTASLPSSAEEVNWNAPTGDVGWAAYQEQFEVAVNSQAELFSAAKNALAQQGFKFKTGDASRGMVVGERGMTANDWNTLAAFYFRQKPNDDQVFDVRIVIEGSKDLGYGGDTMERDYLTLLSASFFSALPEIAPVSQANQASDASCLESAKILLDNNLSEEASKLLQKCASAGQ